MDRYQRIVVGLLAAVAGLALTGTLGIPIAGGMTHGFDLSSWPSNLVPPAIWFGWVLTAEFDHLTETYYNWMQGRLPLPAGSFAWLFGGLTCALVPAVSILVSARDRDDRGIHGQARWANWQELRRLRAGLELGKNLRSGRPIRIKFIGNLMTFAPPRSGKGAGLIIPNLLVPDDESWSGPVIIIDPKGEAATASTHRRRALGRDVVNLDPLSIVESEIAGATWNPLSSCDLFNILKLQRMAGAMIPAATGDNSDSASYFRAKVVEMLVAGMLIVIDKGNPTLAGVRGLVDGEPEHFVSAIEELIARHPTLEGACRGALTTLRSEPRVRDPVKAAATPALGWLSDPRMATFTACSTFQFRDILTGNMDIFFSIPREEIETLSPLLRLFLSELFETVRRGRPAERILAIIDEAFALGRFDEIPIAQAEMPGSGLSLWTIWQTRSQVVKVYGKEGSHTLFQSAEFVTVSNVAAGDGHEAEEWSKAIGNYTALVENDGQSQSSHGLGASNFGTSSNVQKQAARLITPDRLTSERRDVMFVLPNSDTAGTRPMRIRKTRYFDDRRFAGLFRNPKRVGRS